MRIFLGVLAFCVFATVLPAQQSGKKAPLPLDLTTMKLEDLMNLKVTSASKSEQKLSQAATAIFVITQEDIRRSGATNIPDLLRMVPGLDVAQIDANTWAVSARGFNQQFVSKLLVLVDGRAVYTPLLGGVDWDTQDVPLEDIDRIEVIRGPGATLWGANAVNGVINITTKSAAETQGGLITAGAGTQGQASGTVQYGGKFRRNTSYRIFTKYINHGSLPELDGQSGDDSWHLLHGGFRADTAISTKDSTTLQGDIYGGEEGSSIIHIFSIEPPVTDNVNTLTSLSGGNILGRWKHIFSSRSDTALQVYFDHYTRTGPEASETRSTIDFDFHHHLLLGSRHDVIWGAGYRRTWDHTLGTIDQAFNPADQTLQLFNLFAQDTVTLSPDRVFLTIGAKLEHNDYDGFGVQPSVRVAWTPSDWLTFWSAVSRAERIPSRREASLVAGLGAIPDPGGSSTPFESIAYGNPQIKSEYVVAYEAGMRTQAGARISIDASLYFNHYDHLINSEPGAEFYAPSPTPARFIQPKMFENLLYGTTEGAELSANIKVMDRWTLSPGYAFSEMHLHTKPGSQDTSSVMDYEGSNPQHQAQLRSHVELSQGLSWDASAYFVSRLPFQQVPSYTRLDSQLTWRLGERAAISLVGQNLLHDHHLESMDAVTLVNSSLIRRSFYAKVKWSF